MELENIESKQQLLAALKRGDPELEASIAKAVRYEHDTLNWDDCTGESDHGMEADEFIWMVKHWAAPEGESEGPMTAILEHEWRGQGPSSLNLVPHETVNESLEEAVRDAAEDMERRLSHSRRGPHSGSSIFEFATGRGPGIDLRPTYIEFRMNLQAPLAWVPPEMVVDVLRSLGHADNGWELLETEEAADEDDDEATYTSGWTDGGDYWRLEVKRGELNEWAHDLGTEYLSGLVDADPDEAIGVFLKVLKAKYPDLSKRVKKAKFPKDVLADYAVAFFEDEEEGLEILSEATGTFGYEGTRGEVILEVDKAALQSFGLTSGRWWDGAPWKLVNLPVEELAYEGTLMRHCVGRFGMGYREAVARGVTQIWSLRSRFNRPILTFEIDTHDWRSQEPVIRAGAIHQLRGKLNRLSGGEEDEARVLYWIFGQLGVDPSGVADFVGEPFLGPTENPGFDLPWAPYQLRRRARLLRWR